MTAPLGGSRCHAASAGTEAGCHRPDRRRPVIRGCSPATAPHQTFLDFRVWNLDLCRGNSRSRPPTRLSTKCGAVMNAKLAVFRQYYTARHTRLSEV